MSSYFALLKVFVLGIPAHNLEKLILHARISPANEASIKNLSLLGTNIIQTEVNLSKHLLINSQIVIRTQREVPPN